MAENTSLLALINAYIKKNGNQEITGPVLNGVLRAIAYALSTPFIGEDGYWYAYDAETGVFEKTDTPAQGPVGPIGVTEAGASIDSSIGTPSVEVSLNGTRLDFSFHNLKGQKGDTGNPGITNAVVTVDATIGTPSVSANIQDTTLYLAFSGLKGEQGIQGIQGVSIQSVQQVTTSIQSGGTNVIRVTLDNGQTFDFQVMNGQQGNSGYQGAAGELEVVNNLTEGGATKALSAEMGKTLDAELDQLGQKVNQQDVQEEGFYLVDSNLNIGLKFHKGKLTVPTKYNGKKISFLGDSITTFGVPDQNNATGTWTYPGNRCRYPQNDLFADVKYCWWKRLIDKLGATLGINESWAGSRVSNTQATDSGDYGPNRCISSLTRIGHLDDNGTPDIIIVYAGTNDIGGNVTIGTFDTTSPKDLTEQQIAALDVTTFANAYRAMLIRLQYYYQTSRIVVCFPNFTNTYYDMANLDDYIEIIREECDYFGVEYIDLRASGITIYNRGTYLPDGIHPNAGGMELLFNKVYNYLMGN